MHIQRTMDAPKSRVLGKYGKSILSLKSGPSYDSMLYYFIENTT